jgi:molybdate/tungstate transport system substrate-binding protein
MTGRRGSSRRDKSGPRITATRAGRGLGVVALAVFAIATTVFSRTQAQASGRGTVSVLYAGSLVDYMENQLGPSFQRATGYGYQGYGGGSTEVANEIKGGVRQGDVFVSASAKADQALEGAANGGWVSWYSAFAASPLVLAYNRKSAFAAELRRGVPWYKVIAKKGILVGRTDPKLDPKGVLTVEAVEAAARKLHDRALARALGSFSVFPETALVGRLQAGQLDAGFFYQVEAASAHLVTVPLTPVYKYAEYTLTVLNRAQNPIGGAALVRYLLNAARTYTLKRNGLHPQKPRFSGSAASVPANLRHLVGAP